MVVASTYLKPHFRCILQNSVHFKIPSRRHKNMQWSSKVIKINFHDNRKCSRFFLRAKWSEDDFHFAVDFILHIFQITVHGEWILLTLTINAVLHILRKVLQTIHWFHNRYSQSWRRPLLGPSPGWKCLLPLSHIRRFDDTTMPNRHK